MLCVLSVLVPGVLWAAQEELNVFIWSEYIDPQIPVQFEKETGIKVRMDLYESNEDMVAKLQAAREAPRDAHFTIIARTDARTALGWEPKDSADAYAGQLAGKVSGTSSLSASMVEAAGADGKYLKGWMALISFHDREVFLKVMARMARRIRTR